MESEAKLSSRESSREASLEDVDDWKVVEGDDVEDGVAEDCGESSEDTRGAGLTPRSAAAVTVDAEQGVREDDRDGDIRGDDLAEWRADRAGGCSEEGSRRASNIVWGWRLGASEALKRTQRCGEARTKMK
jgi:hypothetical protein